MQLASLGSPVTTSSLGRANLSPDTSSALPGKLNPPVKTDSSIEQACFVLIGTNLA